jgi:hypothetical protein
MSETLQDIVILKLEPRQNLFCDRFLLKMLPENQALLKTFLFSFYAIAFEYLCKAVVFKKKIQSMRGVFRGLPGIFAPPQVLLPLFTNFSGSGFSCCSKSTSIALFKLLRVFFQVQLLFELGFGVEFSNHSEDLQTSYLARNLKFYSSCSQKKTIH